MATIITFHANLENCTNLNGYKNEQVIRSGDQFEFSVWGDQLLVRKEGRLIWSEYIFIENGKFSLQLG